VSDDYLALAVLGVRGFSFRVPAQPTPALPLHRRAGLEAKAESAALPETRR